MVFLKGIGILLLILSAFSLFSLKFPQGDKAMGGLADAAVACFGGSFSNAVIFRRLRLGDNGRVIAVMLEPLTQADIITGNPLPIYTSNFFGGAISGIAAAVMGKQRTRYGIPDPRFAGAVCLQ